MTLHYGHPPDSPLLRGVLITSTPKRSDDSMTQSETKSNSAPAVKPKPTNPEPKG